MRVWTIVGAALLTAGMVMAAPAAQAEKDNAKHEKSGKQEKHAGKSKKESHEGRGGHEDHGDHDGDFNVSISFGSKDRDVIREYIDDHHHRKCPPGLAKKNPDCLPPGQAKKLYTVGHPLEVEWHDLPHDLLVHLSPPPHGHRYVMVDNDVLLMAEGTKKIVDAIALFSSVSQ